MREIVITEVDSTTIQLITTDEHDYIRFSADCWYELMGESYESLYGEAEALEVAYQEYQREQIRLAIE